MRKSRLLLIGIALLAAVVAAALLCSLQCAAWVGRKALGVEVRVVDIDVPEAVAGAEVTIFPGPMTPFESAPAEWANAHFRTDAPDAQTKLTDSMGRVVFSYKFFAYGDEGYWVDRGGVRTNEVWLRVVAPGRPTAWVSVDRQTFHSRDIHDTSPIWVTVVMNRQSPETALPEDQ